MFEPTRAEILRELADIQVAYLRCQSLLSGETKNRDERNLQVKLGALAQVAGDVSQEVAGLMTEDLG